MDEKYSLYLLKKNVQDYNFIAEHFANSRYSIEPESNFFEKYIVEKDDILDLGCGDGRLFQIFKDKKINYLGVDNSEKLIEIAKKKNPKINFQVADALRLPFLDNSFDKIFSIAVLHHIPSKKLRLQTLKEIKRVLRPKALLILTVWNLQEKKLAKKLLLKYTLLKLIGKSRLDFRDIFFPWRGIDRRIVLHRYFHFFSEKGLKNLVDQSGLKVKETGIIRRKEANNSNIYLIAEK